MDRGVGAGLEPRRACNRCSAVIRAAWQRVRSYHQPVIRQISLLHCATDRSS